MKIYSEILNKLFDTEEECVAAEKEHTKKQEEVELQKKESAKAISKEKKELSTAIEEAQQKLDEAYDQYELAKAKAKEMLETSNQQILNILNPAKDNIKKCQEDVWDAVANFNKKFGEYRVRYTNEKALNELKRSTAWINDIFGRFFW